MKTETNLNRRMKHLTFLTLMTLLAFAAPLHAGTEGTVKESPVYRYTVYGDIPVAETAFAEEHCLGPEISPRWNTFLRNYTHEYRVETGLSGSGVEIRKPALFNAVERADRHVRRLLRKGRCSREEAVRLMAHILDCANVLCFEEDTAALEQAAREARSGEAVLALFSQVELVRK